MPAAIYIDSVSSGAVPDAELYVLSLAANMAMSVVCVKAGLSAGLPWGWRCGFKMASSPEKHVCLTAFVGSFPKHRWVHQQPEWPSVTNRPCQAQHIVTMATLTRCREQESSPGPKAKMVAGENVCVCVYTVYACLNFFYATALLSLYFFFLNIEQGQE